MTFDPLAEKGIPVEDQFRSWAEINPEPYDKLEVHPYTRTRVILMNGIENEAWNFSSCTIVVISRANGAKLESSNARRWYHAT